MPKLIMLLMMLILPNLTNAEDSFKRENESVNIEKKKTNDIETVFWEKEASKGDNEGQSPEIKKKPEKERFVKGNNDGENSREITREIAHDDERGIKKKRPKGENEVKRPLRNRGRNAEAGGATPSVR